MALACVAYPRTTGRASEQSNRRFRLVGELNDIESLEFAVRRGPDSFVPCVEYSICFVEIHRDIDRHLVVRTENRARARRAPEVATHGLRVHNDYRRRHRDVAVQLRAELQPQSDKGPNEVREGRAVQAQQAPRDPRVGVSDVPRD